VLVSRAVAEKGASRKIITDQVAARYRLCDDLPVTAWGTVTKSLQRSYFCVCVVPNIHTHVHCTHHLSQTLQAIRQHTILPEAWF
jgi:hypothetical protein